MPRSNQRQCVQTGHAKKLVVILQGGITRESIHRGRCFELSGDERRVATDLRVVFSVNAKSLGNRFRSKQLGRARKVEENG